MKNKKTLTLLLIALFVTTVLLVVGCSPANTETPGQPSNSENESTTNNGTGDASNTTATNGNITDMPLPTQPDFINPLTGLSCSESASKQRPVAMTINNIHLAIPQEGIAKADLIYECNAEGGITRLLCFFQNYKSLEQTGSVRSVREYFIDFAQNHDALLFHAGGSEEAYSQLAQRNIDNFDGVRMGYLGNSYYRDNWRINNMGYEHSLMIKGEGILSAIQKKAAATGKTIRTDLKEDFKSPFNFVKFGTSAELNGSEAKCVYLPFSTYQHPYLKYDAESNTYKRWQYNEPHIDKATGEQLKFTNILVLFCYQSGAVDSYGHINVDFTGTGEGYYITGGQKIDIKYTKADGDTPMKLYNKDGSPLEINRGKTYVAVMGNSAKGQVQLNYNK